AGSREDPRLAHRAAEHLLEAPGLLDQRRRAGEHGADGGAEALAEVDPRGVEAARVVARGHARGDDGIHQPGAVQMRAQAVAARDLEHAVDLRAGPHAPAAEVARLLHAYQ